MHAHLWLACCPHSLSFCQYKTSRNDSETFQRIRRNRTSNWLHNHFGARSAPEREDHRAARCGGVLLMHTHLTYHIHPHSNGANGFEATANYTSRLFIKYINAFLPSCIFYFFNQNEFIAGWAWSGRRWEVPRGHHLLQVCARCV